MSKKQPSKKTTSKKSQPKAKAPRQSTTANKAIAAKRGRNSGAADATARSTGGALADARLPPIGTLIEKKDRYGNVRCECTVEEGGIRYKGNLYRSLSAAAMAAAMDLELTNKTQNGYTFWGLSKPPGKTTDPVAALKHAWEVFERKAKGAIAGRVTDGNRAALNSALLKHAEGLEALRGPVAE